MKKHDRVPEIAVQPYDQFVRTSGLGVVDQKLLGAFVTHMAVPPETVDVGAISRGMSTSRKIMIKASGAFPFVVKIDSAEAITCELRGDTLIRPRVPSLSIPDLAWSSIYEGRGLLAYRYVTKGRVFDPPQRLDVWAETATKYELLQAIDSLYEIVLKKFHWLDGEVRTELVPVPSIDQGLAKSNENTRKVAATYESICAASGVGAERLLLCPVGGVHGDLHAKNVLVDTPQRVILIDFDRARINAPLVRDFVRLDVFLPLAALKRRSDPLVLQDFPRPHYREYDAKSFTTIAERLYRGTELEFPRSPRPLASAVHEIRSVFWRGCLSRTVGMTPSATRDVYRVFLAFEMANFLLKRLAGKADMDDLSFHIVSLAFESLRS